MVKNSKHHQSKVSRRLIVRKWKSVSGLIRRNRWLTLGIVVVISVGVGGYLLQPEDLGPKLPPPPADALYRQAGQPLATRVQDLLARMTLEEKIGQMALVNKNSLKKTEDISKYYLGGVLSGAGAKPSVNTAQGWLDMVSAMKNQATKSRLGIPILYGVDANHGHANVLGATVFPHAIGLGASQNSELVKDVAAATAEELKATGVNWSYSPSVDAPKDIRWGRVYEAFSDDPSLDARLGSAYVTGTQTVSANQPDRSYVLATAKHFLGTGAMVWGKSNHKTFKIDQGKIVVDEQTLANEYLPPYKAVVEAGVSSVMVGLNQWGDKRIIDSNYLLTDKLKKELGFKGFVVSDWYGVYEYSRTSKYQANITTINAGLDMAMLPYNYKAFLADVRKAVQQGSISQSRIDDAVSRILYQKFKAGLFESAPDSNSLVNVGSDKHRLLARQAVALSAVLLKNENSLLPLPKNNEHILVAGSGADNVGRQSGGWTVEWQGVDGNWMPGGTSILQGIRQGVSHPNDVDYKQDASFATGTKANIAIAVVGEKPYAEGRGDNPNPTLDKADKLIIKRLRALSDKLIIVTISGRPLLMNDEIKQADSVIASWLPGSEGDGVADVLFGNQRFTAKLPLPWPSSLQQIPINFNGTTTDRTKLLYDRGFGLTTNSIL